MEEKIYDNAWQLFLEYRILGTQVLSADDPKRLLFGWAAPDHNKAGYLRLTAVRMYKALLMPFDIDGKKSAETKLIELIKNSNGRIQIAQWLSHQKDISEFSEISDRLLKLKAFW